MLACGNSMISLSYQKFMLHCKHKKTILNFVSADKKVAQEKTFQVKVKLSLTDK